MPKTDDRLGRGLEWRLRRALDRVQPPHSAPRYQSAPAGMSLRAAVWRAAPMVAVGLAGLLLTAFAATGSPNPAIWTQDAASAVNSMTHQEPSPTAEPTSAPQQPVRPLSQPSSVQEAPQAPARPRTEPAEPRSESEPPEAERSHPDDH